MVYWTSSVYIGPSVYWIFDLLALRSICRSFGLCSIFGLLASSVYCPSVYWIFDLLALRSIGAKSVYWPFSLLDLRSIGPSVYRSFGLYASLIYWPFGLLDLRSRSFGLCIFGLLALRSIGPSVYWIFDLLALRSIGALVDLDASSVYWPFGL